MSKTVNLGDPYTHRVTLRLTDAQYEFLVKVSGVLGTSPSDYLRMSINVGMNGLKNSLEAVSSGNAFSFGEVGSSHENDKANIDNQL